MNRLKYCCNLFAAFLFTAVPAFAAVPTSSGWAIVAGKAEINGFKLYRRYSYVQGAAQPIPNTITYNCSSKPEDRKLRSYLTVTLPQSFPITSFKRDAHLESIGVRVKVDQEDPFYILAEYRNGELFLDRNKYTEVEFVRMLNADDIDLFFGKDDEIAFHMTEKVDQMLSEINSGKAGISSDLHLTPYSRHDMDQDCSRFSGQK